jgi:8-oxo-dGTP pyrophosphatase MutT (NUDIX family)
MSTKLAHQLTTNVKLLQKAVLTHQNKVLLVKRHAHAQTRPNCWDLPGGNSEWPENITEFTRGLHALDLVREIEEETGLQISPDEFTGNDLAYFDTTFEPDRQLYTILCGWRHELAADAPQITLSSEHVEYTWVTIEELDHYDFGFAEFIPQMIRRAWLKSA